MDNRNDIDLGSLPEFGDDAMLQALIDTFDARVVQAESKERYIGNLTTTVKMGDNLPPLVLPTVRLVMACHKAELENARAAQFAAYLLQLGRENARHLWKLAEAGEGPAFMADVRRHVEWKRANGVLS